MSSTLSQMGKYELRSIVARTPTSTVYDGWDANVSRRVAIKAIRLSPVDDEDAREALVRFKRGVQAAGKLAHPNIISIYNYGETDEYAYIVMEFVDGPTLKQVLDSGKRFDLPGICRVMGSLLEGLQYSHDHGVVHRDIKPANIMFTRDDRVKITDFGIARLDDSSLTQTRMVIGTPAYMAPEQFMGEEVDWRADIYAVGVILYQMLTGARPYDGNMATIMNKVLNAPIPHLSGIAPAITPALEQIISRSMAKKREHRYRSAAEFNAVLQALLQQPSRAEVKQAGVPPLQAPVGPPVVRRRESSRNLPFYVGLALLVAGVTAVGLRLAGVAWPTDLDLRRAETPAASAPLALSTPGVTDQAAPTTINPPDARPEPAPLPPSSETARANPAVLPDAAPSRALPTVAAPVVLPAPVLPAPVPPAPGATEPPAPTTAPDATPEAPHPPASEAPIQPLTQPSAPAAGLAVPPSDKPIGSVPPAAPKVREPSHRSVVAASRPHLAPLPVPAPPAAAMPIPVTSASGIGLVCQSTTAETAREVGLGVPRGMIVLGVTAGSAAAAAGLRSSDVLLSVNGFEMADLSGLKALARQLPPGQPAQLQIFRQGVVRTVSLPLDSLRY